MPTYTDYSIRTRAQAERGLESVDQLAQRAQQTFYHTIGQDDGTLTTLIEFKRDVRAIAGTPRGRRAILMVDEVHSMGVLSELHASVDQNPPTSPNNRTNVNRA